MIRVANVPAFGNLEAGVFQVGERMIVTINRRAQSSNGRNKVVAEPSGNQGFANGNENFHESKSHFCNAYLSSSQTGEEVIHFEFLDCVCVRMNLGFEAVTGLCRLAAPSR